MKKRILSYNIGMILRSFILLLLISLSLFGISRIVKDLTSNLTYLIIVVIVELILIAIAIKVFKMFRNFIKGDEGEMSVRKVLWKLKDFNILTDIILPDKEGNIDLIAIGPTGIWTIEVKNPSEKVIIHDKYLDKNIDQALAEKISLENFLSSLNINNKVTPTLIFASEKARLNFGMVPINGVYVIGIKWLEELLSRHSTGYLNPEKCKLITDTLEPYSSRLN